MWLRAFCGHATARRSCLPTLCKTSALVGEIKRKNADCTSKTREELKLFHRIRFTGPGRRTHDEWLQPSTCQAAPPYPSRVGDQPAHDTTLPARGASLRRAPEVKQSHAWPVACLESPCKHENKNQSQPQLTEALTSDVSANSRWQRWYQRQLCLHNHQCRMQRAREDLHGF